MAKTTPEKRIAAILKDKLRSAETTIAKFEKNLKESPSYAFEWSESAMQAAARDTVFRQVYIALTNDEPTTLIQMKEYVTRQVINKARSPESSTSTTSNRMERYELAAWAEVYEKIDSYYRYSDPDA